MMKTAEKPAAVEAAAVPFKFLLIDDTFRYVVCQPDENPREQFKEFHGRAAHKSKLFAIPSACRVYNDLTHTIPQGAPNFDWVEIKGWR